MSLSWQRQRGEGACENQSHIRLQVDYLYPRLDIVYHSLFSHRQHGARAGIADPEFLLTSKRRLGSSPERRSRYPI